VATILVIDYLPRDREQFALRMRSQGHRLLEATDGAEALTLVRAEQPDLIIGNILVPMTEADAVARHARYDDEFKLHRIDPSTGYGSEPRLIVPAPLSSVPREPKNPTQSLRGVDLGPGDPASPPENRTRAEPGSNETEERFRQLTEQSGQVFWMADLAGTRLFYVSPAYARIWGRSCESLYQAPKSWLEAVHPADRQRVVEGRALAHAAETDDVTYRVVQSDGTIRWIRDRVFPICDASGEIIRVAAVSEDITDLRQAEEELRNYSQRLKAMSEIDCAILMAQASQELAAALLSRIGLLIPLTRACLLTFDLDAGQMTVLSAVDSELMPGSTRPIDELGDMHDLHNGQPHAIDDLLARPHRVPLAGMFMAEGVRSYLALAIKSRGELIGVLILGAHKTGVFTPEHVEMAGEVTTRFAIALQQVRLYEEVRAGQNDLKRLSLQLLQAHEDERRHISRELHDEIGQGLTAAKVNLQSLEHLAADSAPLLPVRDTIAILEHTLRQVHDLSLNLRPSMLDDLGLAPAVRGYLDRQSQRAGFTADFLPDATAAVGRAAPEIETACFRVVQEAVTNIVRHSSARHVCVELRQGETNLEVSIEDDGIGFDVAAARQRGLRGESLGLMGLQERVALVGGRIDIKSTPNEGTRIQAVFPVYKNDFAAAAE
jgi:PAS domain S-box-containing protein